LKGVLSQGEFSMTTFTRLTFIFVLTFLLTACGADRNSCSVSEPVWALPPDDQAVNDPPAYGYYFINGDQSIWASAWWAGEEENYLHATADGGAELKITGHRLDSDVSALEADIPCCYPTRFQATGLYFPTDGCWEVTAKAEESILTFIVRVEP